MCWLRDSSVSFSTRPLPLSLLTFDCPIVMRERNVIVGSMNDKTSACWYCEVWNVKKCS